MYQIRSAENKLLSLYVKDALIKKESDSLTERYHYPSFNAFATLTRRAFESESSPRYLLFTGGTVKEFLLSITIHFFDRKGITKRKTSTRGFFIFTANSKRLDYRG